MSKRSLMLLNSAFRVSYGIGALLAPAKMTNLRLVPETAEHPEAQLFVRLVFSAAGVTTAAAALRASG